MNMRSALVAAGTAVVLGLAAFGHHRDTRADLGRELDAYLASATNERKFSGVALVAKNGQPVFRKAYGFADWTKKSPNTPDTGFMIFSVTKQFTAALILRLQDQKKLDVTDRVSDYVANWPDQWNAVTIHHLLTHSSGIDVDTLYFWLVKYHPKFWEDPAQTPPAYQPRALLSEPGTTFRYSNAGFTVLTLVAEKAGGRPFADLLRAHVFTPLGMRNTGFEGIAPTPARARGHRLTPTLAEILEQKTHFVVGAGDVISTLDDMLKWDESLYGSGFLSDAARKAMFTPFVKAKRGGLGYGWLMRDTTDGRPMPLFSGSGSGFTAYVIRRPESHLYVAVLSNMETEGEFPYGLGVLERTERILGNP